MVRYYAVFKGIVQGVGFRWYMLRYAQAHNITGWVRNRADYAVEAQLQGNSSDINSLINYLGTIEYIVIDDYSLMEMELISDEQGFDVKF